MRGLQKLGIMVSTVVAVGALSHCTQPDAPVQPSRPPVSPPFTAAVLKKNAPHMRFDLGWIGEMHNEAIAELIATKSSWANPKLGGTAKSRGCVALARLGKKYAAIAARRTGLRDEGVLDADLRKALVGQGCESTVASMLWTPIASSRFDDSLSASGNFGNYTGALEAAIAGASDPADAAIAIDAVIANATDLNDGDVFMLEAAASVGIASNYYWYAEEMSGALDATLDSLREWETSIFAAPRMRLRWGALGWADLYGGLTGAAAMCQWTAGACVFAPGPTLAVSVVGAVIGSGGALIAMM